MEGFGGTNGRNDIISKSKEMIKITFICICVLTTFMPMHHLCAWGLRGPEDGVRSSGN